MIKRIVESNRQFLKGTLEKEQLLADPLQQFIQWFDEAQNRDVTDANAMSLATVDSEGQPSIRIVLVKEISEQGLQFFSNYESRKGKDLDTNPKASVLFYWQELERQVRIEGVVERISTEESDEYFESRLNGTQLGAWASHQSDTLFSREEMERRYEYLVTKFANRKVPRPKWWGGYRLKPEVFEFWQGRDDRLHDRFKYYKKNNGWRMQRLAP